MELVPRQKEKKLKKYGNKDNHTSSDQLGNKHEGNNRYKLEALEWNKADIDMWGEIRRPEADLLRPIVCHITHLKYDKY